MNLRDDWSQRVVVDTAASEWVPSPEPGVRRILLDRVGGEVARATSLVEYAPGSRFAAHDHGEGEEFYVLDGTFVDERGAYPAGTYVRNPPGSRHAPSSPEGCRIFVKLRQFAADDLQRVVLDTRILTWGPGRAPGQSALLLHEHRGVTTSLLRFSPGAVSLPHAHERGEEILVLDGGFSDEHGSYGTGAWLRSPHGSGHQPRSEEGCLLYVKTGHLPA